MTDRTDPLSRLPGEVVMFLPDEYRTYLRSSLQEQYNMLAGIAATPRVTEPAGHRVTLTRPRFLRSPLVITTNANPSHADALRDLRYQFKAVTGRPYLPHRGDTISHEVTK